MEVETSVAQMCDSVAKLVQRSRAAPQGSSDLHALAEVETFQRRLAGKMGKRLAKVTHHAAEIAAKRGDGDVVANVQRRQLFRQVVPVGVREHPLREVVGKSLGEKVMAAKCLIGVMKDGSVAAILESLQQIRESARRLVTDSCEIRNGNELERSFRRFHAKVSSLPEYSAELISRRTAKTALELSRSRCLWSLHALRQVHANLREIGEKIRRPAVYVVLSHSMPHPLHPARLLLLRHLQRPMDGFRELRDIVRIHQQRIRKFVRRARKGAKNQRPAFVVARSHVFLGHQVHSIVQRGHHAEGRRAIEAGNLLMRMVFLSKHDRFPSRGLKPRIDALRFSARLIEELLVALNIRAAGRADLDESEALLVRGIQFEKSFQCAETLQDSLSVVDAIDAHSEKRSLNIHLGAKGGAFCARILRLAALM